jgi:hypothetical protein
VRRVHVRLEDRERLAAGAPLMRAPRAAGSCSIHARVQRRRPLGVRGVQEVRQLRWAGVQPSGAGSCCALQVGR